MKYAKGQLLLHFFYHYCSGSYSTFTRREPVLQDKPLKTTTIQIFNATRQLSHIEAASDNPAPLKTELSHTIYWESPFSILGMLGYMM